jgi:hypothetical protein
MSTNNTYLAVFLGSKISPKMTEWNGNVKKLRHGRRGSKSTRTRFSAWADRSARPRRSLSAVSKTLATRWEPTWSFAQNRHEAAAKLFENHPHFVIFPGESVEIMPVLPIPGA